MLLVRNPRGMIQRDHSAQARLLRVKVQARAAACGQHLVLSPVHQAYRTLLHKVEHMRNPVRLLRLDESHDVIQTRIHDEIIIVSRSTLRRHNLAITKCCVSNKTLCTATKCCFLRDALCTAT
jgi:hypothetical protein